MSSIPNSAKEIDPCASNLFTTALGTYEFIERTRAGNSGLKLKSGSFMSNLLVTFNFTAGVAAATGEGEEVAGLVELTYCKGLDETSKNFLISVPLIMVIPARELCLKFSFLFTESKLLLRKLVVGEKMKRF